MRTARRWSLVALTGLLLAAAPGAASAGGHGWGHGGGHWGGHHDDHTHVFVGVGTWWGPGWWGPGWWAPGWWGPNYAYYGYGYYPPYYAPPPPATVAEPPVYVERPPVSHTAGFWYFCESAGGYYPNVETCPEPWVKVPPRPE